MKKRFTRALIASLVVMLLSGCASDALPSNTSGESNVAETDVNAPESGELAPATISVWFAGSEGDPNNYDVNVMTTAIELFTEQNPQIKIEKTVLSGPGGSDYTTKLKAEVAAGSVPDVFVMWADSRLDAFVASGAAMDITDIVKSDEKLSEIVDFNFQQNCIYNDRLYGLNRGLSSVGLFYNTALFEQYGLEPPKTIDELKQVSEVFLENGITPIAMGNSVNWTLDVPFTLLTAELMGYDTFQSQIEDGSIKLNSPEAKEAMLTVHELSAMGVFTKDYGGIKPAEAMASFKAGEAAMFLQGSWNAVSLDESMGDTVGFIPFPTYSADSGISHIMMDKVYVLGSKSEGAEREAAIAFFKFLNSEEMVRYQVEAGGIPAHKNIDLSQMNLIPVQKSIMECVNNVKHPTMQFHEILSASVSEELFTAIISVASDGNADRLDALQDYFEMYG